MRLYLARRIAYEIESRSLTIINIQKVPDYFGGCLDTYEEANCLSAVYPSGYVYTSNQFADITIFADSSARDKLINFYGGLIWSTPALEEFLYQKFQSLSSGSQISSISLYLPFVTSTPFKLRSPATLKNLFLCSFFAAPAPINCPIKYQNLSFFPYHSAGNRPVNFREVI